MFAGLTNRGWSSLGPASYGLQRIVWTGKTPFEIREVRARPDGFELLFTKPLDRAAAANVDSYRVASHTYLYQAAYGSDEIQRRELAVNAATVSSDGMRVRLRIGGLRELFVHELTLEGVRSSQGAPLLHATAYYTLNRIPTEP